MGVEEGDRGGGDLWALELLDAGLETGDVFAHDLGPGLALAVIVLAGIGLLRADALLTCGFDAVASLCGGMG